MESNSRPSQAQRVLSYLHKHGSITQYEAMVDLGVMRLASRIAELKQSGQIIESQMVSVKNRFGETCHVKRYTLQGGQTP